MNVSGERLVSNSRSLETTRLVDRGLLGELNDHQRDRALADIARKVSVVSLRIRPRVLIFAADSRITRVRPWCVKAGISSTHNNLQGCWGLPST